MNGISLFYQIASGDYGLITNERCYFYSPLTDAVTTNNVKIPTEVAVASLCQDIRFILHDGCLSSYLDALRIAKRCNQKTWIFEESQCAALSAITDPEKEDCVTYLSPGKSFTMEVGCGVIEILSGNDVPEVTPRKIPSIHYLKELMKGCILQLQSIQGIKKGVVLHTFPFGFRIGSIQNGTVRRCEVLGKDCIIPCRLQYDNFFKEDGDLFLDIDSQHLPIPPEWKQSFGDEELTITIDIDASSIVQIIIGQAGKNDKRKIIRLTDLFAE